MRDVSRFLIVRRRASFLYYNDRRIELIDYIKIVFAIIYRIIIDVEGLSRVLDR